MSILRRSARLVAALACAGGALILGPSPADAHPTNIVFPGISAAISSNHEVLTVCWEGGAEGPQAKVRYSGGTVLVYGDNSVNGMCESYILEPNPSLWRLCYYGTGGCSGWFTV